MSIDGTNPKLLQPPTPGMLKNESDLYRFLLGLYNRVGNGQSSITNPLPPASNATPQAGDSYTVKEQQMINQMYDVLKKNGLIPS